jgi:anaerobic magnesium-protoporphyrin IX monomethyl ester cyclase
MYRRARSKSPEKVVEELDYLNEEFGFSSFMWFDDELNLNPKRVIELSRLLGRREYSHRGFVRSDMLLKHPETLESLIDAGFIELCSGFEYGSRRLLDATKKGTTPEQNALAARMIMDKGVRYKCFGIVGGPGETYEEVMETKKWLQEVRPDGFDITILSPYPGSELYNHSVPSTKYSGFDREWNGLYFKRPDFAENETFYKGIPGRYPCNIRTDELTSEELIALREGIERDLKKEQ